ncbi:MAG: hypothetical protein RBT74_02145 [Tenuifilaceae bacterium]|jgi:hypothetical protein|nr:hypothetical protein [Tenuifilaceae bacterium]
MKSEKQIILVDELTINSIFGAVDRLTSLLNEARDAYCRIFPDFDIDLFIGLFDAKKPEVDITKRYLVESNFDLPGIDLEKALTIGLIKGPDTKPITESIRVIKGLLKYLPVPVTPLDFGLMYDEEHSFFPRSYQGKTLFFEKIRQTYTYTPETEEELAFIDELQRFAELFVKFKKDYLMLPEHEIPMGLFSLRGDKLAINPRVLRSFRHRRGRD